jgi:hypothetical protein
MPWDTPSHDLAVPGRSALRWQKVRILREDSQHKRRGGVTSPRDFKSRGKLWEPDHEDLCVPKPGFELAELVGSRKCERVSEV